ncbi:DegT/DnrJ/EryC1/StrS family aminotransferase [Micromonospora zamorensis]|uniref:DegT/DnrJ/EryC1/StrS family aminotransferase n=1 Tax=Micromonospora zamorensis TaxID=709883 RepID=UPI003CF9BAC6
MSKLAMHGGHPVRARPYPTWPTYAPDDVRALEQVLSGDAWGGHPVPRPATRRFTTDFARYQGARHCVLTSSGTTGLEVALRALGIGEGDEVIVPCLSFMATAAAVISAGARPVFVDVEAATAAMDPDHVAAAVTSRTRAIMPVHLAQHMADMDRLTAIARKAGVAIVEDAAQAHGQRWREVGAGCFGEFGIFSHQDSKGMAAGEGGSILTSDEQLAHAAESIVDCGRARGGGPALRGGNHRMTDLQAALLNGALTRFPAQREMRAAAAAQLESTCTVPGVTIHPADPRLTRLSFSRFSLSVEPAEFAGADGLTVRRALEAEGIPCWAPYPSVGHYDLFEPWVALLRQRCGADAVPAGFDTGDALWTRQIYLRENVFRDGPDGIADLVEALAKVHDGAGTLSDQP